MLGYTFSCKVHDAVFGSAVKVITVDAASIPAAIALCASTADVLEVGMLLGTIDRQPQGCLAW